MSNEESESKRSIILWTIGLSILVVALISITFVLMFPNDLPTTTINQGFDREIPGLNTPFPIIDNDCLTDFKSYVEIKNKKVDAGWIHYGNATDIAEFLGKYCSMTPDEIDMMRMMQGA